MTAGIVCAPALVIVEPFLKPELPSPLGPSMTQPIILTALHLFGPAGGLERDISATQIPSRLSELKLTDCINRTADGILYRQSAGSCRFETLSRAIIDRRCGCLYDSRKPKPAPPRNHTSTTESRRTVWFFPRSSMDQPPFIVQPFKVMRTIGCYTTLIIPI